MQDAQTQPGETNLLLRSDTMLGICEGIGQDFGFNPDWLRVALGAGLLWNPVAMVGIYLGLGMIVAISRLLFPAPQAAAAPQPLAPADAAAAAAPLEPEGEPERERELVAA